MASLSNKLKENIALQKERISEKKLSMYHLFLWLAFLLTFLVYLPVLNNNFVNWDDSLFILNNPHIKSLNLASLKWMFTSFYAGFLIPIYWLSLALDYRLGHLEAWVYHLDNCIIHSANTVLVFCLSHKILKLAYETKDGGKKNVTSPWIIASAFFASLLFGIHPIHVESVAWATERKDLLCGFFFLSSILVYLEYATQPDGKKWRYSLCLCLLILALLSKPMAVSLPFVLLLLDYWPLDRFHRKFSKVLLEKLPFFIVVLLQAGATTLFQIRTGNVISLNVLPLSFRILNSFHSLFFYLEKILYPINLTAFYPIFLINTYSPEYLCSGFLFILITLGCFIYHKKCPYLIVAWLYYLVTLAPVIGLLQANSVAAADRYTYLPSISPFLLLTGVIFKKIKHWNLILITLGSVWIGFLGYKTVQQIYIWKDSIALWENVVKVTPKNNVIVYTNLAASYEEAGRWDDAMAAYDQAIATMVPLSNPHYGKGKILVNKGLLDEAIQEFNIAIALEPTASDPHSDLGMVYERKGLHELAINEVRKAISLDPENAQAYFNLGKIYKNQGKYDDSIEYFKKAVSLDPDKSSYLNDLNEAEKKGS